MLEGELLHPPDGRLHGVERRLGISPRQAAQAARRGASAFLSLSEGVAIPLALADGRRTPHVAVVHNAMRPRIRALERSTHALRRIDRVVVLARSHETFLRRHARVPPEKLRFIHDKVDHRFWRPASGPTDGSVLSVGAEARDYDTLLSAVAPLKVPTTVVAGSLWAGAGARPGARLPETVAIRTGLEFLELRSLYERAAIVVVPLMPGLLYAAGVNAVLEAMAMGKALIVTATPGIADYVDHGLTARTVPPRDPHALSDAIADLLGDAGERAALGARARRVVETGRNLDTYVQALAGIVHDARGD